MTTHEGHDHPNTKAGRAACRRAAQAGLTTEEMAKRRIQDNATDSRKAQIKARAKRAKVDGRKVEKPINTSLPHAYDPDSERPDRCYVCRLTRTARVHSEGPTDLSARFGF